MADKCRTSGADEPTLARARCHGIGTSSLPELTRQPRLASCCANLSCISRGYLPLRYCVLSVHTRTLSAPRKGAIRSGVDMSMEAQISIAHRDLDAFGPGGPPVPAPMTLTDQVHALVVARADGLMGCAEGSPEETELAALADAIDAYEAIRWPQGKRGQGRTPSAKG